MRRGSNCTVAQQLLPEAGQLSQQVTQSLVRVLIQGSELGDHAIDLPLHVLDGLHPMSSGGDEAGVTAGQRARDRSPGLECG